MNQPHLKIFSPDDRTEHDAKSSSTDKSHVLFNRVVGEARVAISVRELLPLLADAWQNKRAWLNDFDGDRVIVSQDLYEVLLAYKRYRSTSAA